MPSEPLIMQAAQSNSILDAALMYTRLGMSVVPLRGKRPSLASWSQFQHIRADAVAIHRWHRSGLLHNVGIVCGAASQNLVVLDADGPASYPAFAALFPKLAETYTVATGSGKGHHVYFYVEQLPDSIKAMNLPIGNLELCANGRQVVGAPSIHPTTNQTYRVHKPLDILRVESLTDLVEWLESFKAKPVPTHLPFTPPHVGETAKVNPRVMEAIEQHFLKQGYREIGEWLHGPCIYPHRHQHGDRNPSFGFHRLSGYGACFVCGTILAKDICVAIGIDVSPLGGLVASYSNTNLLHQPTAVRLPPAPLRMETPRRDIPATANRSSPVDPPTGNPPPDESSPRFSISDLQLPDWLKLYVEWAGATGNQTPLMFHLAAGLWLLSVAVGRRLYGMAPWGVKIYPNLYLMLIAGTTYYRKSTAYKLAEQIAREAIPHMLMPTPGSPERFQESLSGLLPPNFDKLTKVQQERLTKAQPFAAQRGLLKDEVAGLFGTINKKDYMTGMKDLLMELYDCPDYTDKDTQSGLTIVENAALSILGVTTPSSLRNAVTDADWSNGLLIRFGLLTPEADYQERPFRQLPADIPQQLVSGLRQLHERLPMPQMTEHGLIAPKDIELKVECWPEISEYSEQLRRQCNPLAETNLDERLKGVYGRMHVQAFKLASLIAALEWVKIDAPAPIVTAACWEKGKAIAEMWRESGVRLLHLMDYRSDALCERRDQDKLLEAIRHAGPWGCNLRDLYRKFNLPAKAARQSVQELVRAGLVVERSLNHAEWYIAADFAEQLI